MIAKPPPKKKPRKRAEPVDVPVKWSHDWWVRAESDVALCRIICLLRVQNLSNYRDEETRWCAGRLSAARREVKRRKNLNLPASCESK